MTTVDLLLDSSARSLGAMFFERVNASPGKEAFRYPRDGRWVSVTWRDTASRVEAIAAGLLVLGIEPEQRVGIVSSTRLEWVLADLAIVSAGAATTSVYANTNVEDTVYILGDSGCRVVFAENEEQLAKLAAHRGELGEVTQVVLFDGDGDGGWVMTLNDLAEMGAKYLLNHPGCVRDTIDLITPDRLASLIYTSGTTGRPKGVRLLHSAWVYQGAAVAALGVVGPDDIQLLWLPLAHSFGKVLIAAHLACGFVTAIDGHLDRIVDNAGAVRPTFMAGVPRVFEKAHTRILSTAEQRGRLSRMLFRRAFAVGREVGRRRRAGEAVSFGLNLQHKIFDRIVFARIRAIFGGRIRFFVSGSAPLNRDIAEWFHAAGMLILEGYGLTETAGGAFINTPGKYRLGTVGHAFTGTDARIGADGEVQIKGPNIMAGYHNVAAATAEVFTDDGWLHTGDKGAFDADGFLTITGRIKELFKTSGGKYVVPPAIEAQFVAQCPYASQFLVLGEGRKYCVALVSLDADAIAGWAAEHELATVSYSELAKAPAVHDLIDEYVRTLNAGLNQWETIKNWAILDHDMSVDSGELTPTLKVKRAVVAKRYQELIDSLYR